ncbi:hypothetical protein GCM10023214_15740 [Amycolatopsis dongchuanensis]|uniref:Uncharacterized protein n=1 Tax=Amycolatopsis dongchuanensis TaxID=1070866 RepID=A0ABP9Q5H6_9PSEU
MEAAQPRPGCAGGVATDGRDPVTRGCGGTVTARLRREQPGTAEAGTTQPGLRLAAARPSRPAGHAYPRDRTGTPPAPASRHNPHQTEIRVSPSLRCPPHPTRRVPERRAVYVRTTDCPAGRMSRPRS